MRFYHQKNIFINMYNQSDVGLIFAALNHKYKNNSIMKKFLLLALPLFVFSCKPGVSAHKDAITKLGTDWDAATTAVTAFAEGLTKEVTSFTEQGQAMTLDSAAIAGLKGDAGSKYKMALDAYRKATVDSYTPVQGELTEFVSMWTEKAGSLSALKDGLAAGKIEGDVPAKIAELTSLVTQGTAKVGTWTAKQAEIKTAADAALATLKTAYETVAKK